MKHLQRLLAALLAVLLLATPLLAAGPYEAGHSARQEDLDALLANLEEIHPDLYANVSRQAVADRKAYIEQTMDNWDDFTFSVELRSLVGMVRDSHTSIGVRAGAALRKLPLDLELLDGKWILSAMPREQERFLGGELLTLNGLTMDEIQKKFSTFFCADNEVRARRVLRQTYYMWDLLVHFGVIRADQETVDLRVRTRAGGVETMTVAPLTTEETNALVSAGQVVGLTDLCTGAAATAPDNVYYKWLDLGGGNLYLQYNACMEDPDLPMETFAAQVAEQLDTGRYGRVLVDFRNNGGGSDGVIWSLLPELLELQQQGGELVALIGEATFSSAIINAVQMKQLGAVLVGEPTGGSVNHFGSVRSFQLPNSGQSVSVSTKYIDLGDYYAAGKAYGVEPLRPDLPAAQTLEDLLAGVDTAVEAAVASPAPAPAQSETAAVSDAAVRLDGKPIVLPGYRIGGEHYVAVRDAAAALSGTAAQFDVRWHGEDHVVEVLPGQAYTAVGGELEAPERAETAAAPVSALLFLDQMPLQLSGQPGGLRVYRIGDRHYLRLRDLGAKLGFAVTWNAAETAVELKTQ